MPRRSRARSRSRRTRRSKGSFARGAVKVKGHTRSPRGPDRGKKPVRVQPHRRKLPR